MRKTLWTIFAIFVLLATATFVTLSYSADILAHYLTKITKVPVTIESISFHPDRFIIKNLKMENPPQYNIRTALAVKEITFKAPYRTYFLPNIDIDLIHLNDMYISIIFDDRKNTSGNWTHIIKNIHAHLGDDDPSDDRGRIVQIEKFLLTQVQIELLRYGKRPLMLKPIEKVSLENICSARGLPMKQITHIVVRQTIKSLSIAAGFQDMLKSFVEVPGSVVKMVFKPFGFLFGGGDSSPPKKKQPNN